MFSMPKKALYKPISRRKFLELGGGVATVLGAGSIAVGMNSVITRRPVYAYSSDEAKWRQYEGSKLVFMSENTPPSFAIRDNIQAFYDLTGIEVEILTDGLPTVQQKVGIDLRSGQADYHLNYVQDKPIGSPFADFYADLNEFSVDDTLPLDPQGYGSDVWFENYLDACGVYYERGPIRAFPYDCAVSCTFYRQDLFEQLTKDFEADYGYRTRVHLTHRTYKNMAISPEFSARCTIAILHPLRIPPASNGSFGWTTQLDIQRITRRTSARLRGRRHAGLERTGPPDQLGRRPVGQRDGRLQGTRRCLPSRQPDQRDPGAEHGLRRRRRRHADPVPRVRGLG